MIDNSQYAEKGNVGRAGSVIWPKNPDPRINGSRPRIFSPEAARGITRLQGNHSSEGVCVVRRDDA